MEPLRLQAQVALTGAVASLMEILGQDAYESALLLLQGALSDRLYETLGADKAAEVHFADMARAQMTHGPADAVQ